MEHGKKETSNGGAPRTYQGSCHCGTVRFECDADLSRPASRCNCSVCTKLAWLGGVVKPEAFRLLAGEENLAVYAWGFKTGTRRFCKTCGTHCFGPGDLPQLGGAYVSVNYNCLDGVEVKDLKVVYWDGRHNNWQAALAIRPGQSRREPIRRPRAGITTRAPDEGPHFSAERQARLRLGERRQARRPSFPHGVSKKSTTPVSMSYSAPTTTRPWPSVSCSKMLEP
jgi:hypothetical protein